ncbi:LURP-one-related/scramblase family protein [Arcanobacterium ihumii]|uniref:LURP-one-related/scramblase family protein n=1 Tax=Arcanobacterium ihumii TaxID=2138162 RepID=UPI000F52AB99|nr:hypothetical protein [Arcanobacterium ihumii]
MAIDQNPVPASLLDNTTFIMQQVNSVTRNDFEILDGSGNPIGSVQTMGGVGSRLLLGARSFNLCELDGTIACHIEDTVNFGRDRYEITDHAGNPLASLIKKITFLRTKVEITLANGQAMELVGNPMGMEYQFVLNGQVVGAVARQWAGLAKGLLGHSRYALTMHPEAPTAHKLAMLGSAVALDCIRNKNDGSTGALNNWN